MLRLTTNVTSSPTTSRRSESASNGIQGRAVGGGQRQILVVGAAGRIVLGRPQRGQHVGVDALGARAANSTFSRIDSQSPNALPKSLRVSVRRPSRSIAVCRSVRPSDSVASSGSCHGRPTGLTSRASPVSGSASAIDVPVHPRVDPRRAAQHVRRLRGQPLHQVVAGLGGDVGQLVQRRPGSLGVDVIGRQRRHPAPVVDPGADQRQAFGARHQVRRRLDAHLGPQHQPGDGHRRQKLLDAGVGHASHRGVFLGPEVLHDHFLDVSELLVRPADRMHGLGALDQRLADADQQSGGERDGQPARIVQRAQPHRGVLVRAAVMRQPLGLEQPPRRGLQHHAHRRGHRLEPRQLRPAHHARVQVRQQPVSSSTRMAIART